MYISIAIYISVSDLLLPHRRSFVLVKKIKISMKTRLE